VEDHHGEEAQEDEIEESQESQTCHFGAQEKGNEKDGEKGQGKEEGNEEVNDKQGRSDCPRID
jgi:hypothetical protein